MRERHNISSGAKWEDIAGYSRAVRIGNHVHVSGTVASGEDGAVVGDDDAYAQTVYIIQKIEQALQQAGASLGDVIRTRMYVTDISRWEDIARAHAEFFGQIRPATTMIEVSRLIDPAYLVEIEAEAIMQT